MHGQRKWKPLLDAAPGMVSKQAFAKKIRKAYLPIPKRALEQATEGVFSFACEPTTKELVSNIVKDYVKSKWIANKMGIKNRQKILELGSGFGNTSLLIGEKLKNGRVVCLEQEPIRQKFFKRVTKKYVFSDGKRADKKITPVLGDFWKPPFKPSSFDRILIRDALDFSIQTGPNRPDFDSDLDYFTKDKFEKYYDKSELNLFKKWHNLLKPKGRLIIYDADIGRWRDRGLKDTMDKLKQRRFRIIKKGFKSGSMYIIAEK